MASALEPLISPHTGKRRRAPYSRDVCDFCRDSKKRCQTLSPQPNQPSTAASPSASTTTICVACHHANIPCIRSRKRKQQQPNRTTQHSSSAEIIQSVQPFRPFQPSHSTLTSSRVSRFGAGTPWLAPLPSPASYLNTLGAAWGNDVDSSSSGSFISVRLVRDMPQYFTSYFRLVNDGLYHYLDERQFMNDYVDIVVDRVLSPDTHWALTFHSVMAIGARIHGDLPYAQHCAAIAMKACQSLSGTVPSQSAPRLALTFRAMLALIYYSACVEESDDHSVKQLLSRAQYLLGERDVVSRLPVDVTRLVDSIPQFEEAFSLSPLPVCSVAEQLSYQRQAYPNDQQRFARLESTLAAEDSARRRQQQQRQRGQFIIQPDGAAAGPSNGESAGEAGDGKEDGVIEMDTQRALDELQRLNSSLAGDTFMRSPVAVDWSIYHALMVLLRAERCDSVQDLQRVIVFGRRAQCYLLLGQLEPAVQAARRAMQQLAVYNDTPLSKYPPYTLILIRVLVILRTLDTADDAAVLIETGLAILRKLAALWPALQRHLTQWSSSVPRPSLPSPAFGLHHILHFIATVAAFASLVAASTTAIHIRHVVPPAA